MGHRAGSAGEPGEHRAGSAGERDPDGERTEPGFIEDFEILPDQTGDDTDAGWGERRRGNESRLIEERPPHWQ